MKIKFKSLPKGEKDAFSEHLAAAEWAFKLFGWMILIGTLKYAAQVTGNAAFTIWALALTLEIGWLALAFVRHRVELELVGFSGKRPRIRLAVNVLFAGLIGWLAWQSATWFVNEVATGIIEFNKAGKEVGRQPAMPGTPRPER